MAVLCIVQDSHFVVIEVNFIDECVNQCLSVFSIVDVSLTELVEEESYLIYRRDCIRSFFQKYLLFQIVMFSFLLRNTFRQNFYQLTTFKSLEKVFCCPFILFQ